MRIAIVENILSILVRGRWTGQTAQRSRLTPPSLLAINVQVNKCLVPRVWSGKDGGEQHHAR